LAGCEWGLWVGCVGVGELAVVTGLLICLISAEGLGQVVIPLAAFLILQSLLSAGCSLL
jgi:hypothetical protein